MFQKTIVAVASILATGGAVMAAPPYGAAAAPAQHEQAEDLTANTVRQGYVEGANVNPILEMTRLIAVSRAFDNAVAAIQQSDSKSEDSIRTLGPA